MVTQMVLAVVLDGEGRPVCTEMLAGNTADMTVLLPVVDRLRRRFGIGRVCVVADRGMISAATIAALEERGLEYVLGTRERGDVQRCAEIVLEEREAVCAASDTRIKSTAVRFRGVDKVHDIDSIRFRTFCGVLDTNGGQCHAAPE